MFGLKKEEPITPVAPQAPVTPSNSSQDNVYVMPDQFHPIKAKTGSNKPLVIALIILTLAIIGSVIYFLYDLSKKSQVEPVNSNQSVNINTSLGNNGNNALGGNDNKNDNENDNTNNENDNSNGNTNTGVPPQLSSDSDRDGLTDLEEAVMGSQPTKPDTDGDGYLDGQEVNNGYSPVTAGSDEASKLPAAVFIEKLVTDFTDDNFSTLYIKDWQVDTIDTLHQIRITAKDTGEIIKISVVDNPEKLSSVNWYLDRNPLVRLDQLRQVNVGDLSGIFSPDGLKAYLTDRNKFYVFEYDIMDDQGEIRYPAIFNMIVKNFKLVEGVATLKKVSEDDEYVYYEGKIAVSGKYRLESPANMLGSILCFYADDETGILIPRENWDSRSPWFCFSDQNETKNIFNINEEEIFDDTSVECIEGDANIEISNYIVNKKEAAVYDTAKLENIILKEDYSTMCE